MKISFVDQLRRDQRACTMSHFSELGGITFAGIAKHYAV